MKGSWSGLTTQKARQRLAEVGVFPVAMIGEDLLDLGSFLRADGNVLEIRLPVREPIIDGAVRSMSGQLLTTG